ncbi:MAG: hypothetical protein ACK5L4_10060, partial [Pseudanabaena sp.]
LYNNSQIWVYGDFLLEDIDTLPAGWISTQKLLPNVRDHRASRCDDAKQKRSLWPAPVHRLVGQMLKSIISKFIMYIEIYLSHNVCITV